MKHKKTINLELGMRQNKGNTSDKIDAADIPKEETKQ